MADRYWVGGTDTWNATAGSKWSTTSGGAGGAAVPTASDDVYFDANSGSVTVTISSVRSCLNLDCTGFVGTLSAGYLYCYRSVIFSSSMTFNGSFDQGLVLASNVGGQTITSNGLSLSCGVNIIGTGAWQLQDAFTAPGYIFHTAGDLDFNEQAVSCGHYYFGGTNARSIDMTNSTLLLTATGTVFENSVITNQSLTVTGSTIKVTDTSSSQKTFIGGGQTYNDLWYAGGGAGELRIGGANTFNDFKVDPSCTFKLAPALTHTATTWTISGTASNLVTLTSTSAAAHTIAKAGGGTVNVDYVDVSYSTASPSSTFFAGANSVDSGNNTNWTFGTPPPTGDNSAGFTLSNQLFNYVN